MNEFVIILLLALVVMLLGGLLRARRMRSLVTVAEPVTPVNPWDDHPRREAERRAENDRPYEPDDLPESTTELSIIEYHDSYGDETYAAVYLLAGRVSLPTSDTSFQTLFQHYWDLRGDALWSWRDDNLSTRVTGNEMTATAHSRALTMTEVLTQAGWRVTGRVAHSEALRTIYLRR